MKKKYKEKFERIVNFGMPFDKRTEDPKTNYGIGSMIIWFILKGRKGAVQIQISTGLYLPSTIVEYFKTGKNLFTDYKGEVKKPFDCWDVGFHSKKKPKYMNKSDQRKCNIIGQCYYDGSALRGDQDKIPELFLEKGAEGIWKYLKKYYKEVFK